MPRRESLPVIGQSQPVSVRDQTVWRDPARFPGSALIILDYDLTCFDTFNAPEGSYEVHEAYESAVEQVLSKEAKQDFSIYGGLSNRAPLDVIEGLVTTEPRFIMAALDHAKTHFANPDDISDIGLGLIARFARRDRLDADELTLRAITEMLVIRKKEILIPQICEEWPKPIPGFIDTWLELKRMKSTDETPQLELAFASSGHTDFISETMETHGLGHPDIYMTDDEMRRQVHPRTKPDPLALALLRTAWLNAYLVPKSKRKEWLFQSEARSREIYVGDDALKDGEMARRDGIAFLHFTPKAPNWSGISRELIALALRGQGAAGR